MNCNYPDCDGGPATGYCHVKCRETQRPGAVPSLTLEEVAEKLDAILDKYQMPKFNPIGWSEADYERTADWVEPMRREIERIRELCLQAQEWREKNPWKW